jgi:hypothetical protein
MSIVSYLYGNDDGGPESQTRFLKETGSLNDRYQVREVVYIIGRKCSMARRAPVSASGIGINSPET